MKISLWIRLSFALLLCVVIAFIFRASLSFEFFSLPRIFHAVELARSHRWMIVIFYVLFVFGVMIFPITLFPIIGGVLLDFPFALPLNIAAATAGAYVSFLLTRRLGRDAIHKVLQKRMHLVDALTSKQGFKSVLFLRLMGVPPFIVTNYALGLSAVNDKDFLMATFIGILPWMSVVTHGAQALWQAAEVGGQKGFRAAVIDLITPFTIISIFVLITTLISLYLRRKKNQTNSEPKKSITAS